MNTNKKISLTLTGREQSFKRLCEFEGVAVSYNLSTDRLEYYIPSGFTVGELRDWSVKYNSEISKAITRKGIAPSERVLRELSVHKPKKDRVLKLGKAVRVMSLREEDRNEY